MSNIPAIQSLGIPAPSTANTPVSRCRRLRSSFWIQRMVLLSKLLVHFSRWNSFSPIHYSDRQCWLRDGSLGNCAIAVGFTRRFKITEAIIRGVLDSLLAQCKSNPFLTHSGGAAVSGSIGAVAMRPHGKIRSSAQLPFDIEIEQNPFLGPPISTCAWGFVSRHAGDVRQCPAPHG